MTMRTWSPPRFIRMRAEDTFDGQERVFSRRRLRPPGPRHRPLRNAAATPGTYPTITSSTWTASASRPRSPRRNYAPSAPGNASAAATASWTGKPSNTALDLVRQRKGEDPRALAADQEHQAKIQARMAKPMVITPPCAACGAPAAHIELVAPGQLPAGWDQWPGTVQGSFLRRPEPGQWYLLVKGTATRNSYGGPIDAGRAGQIAWAFRPPLRFAQVHTARFDDDAGFCPDCEVPYCHQHWHLSDTGYGYCPYGHGKDLDPHWSPLADLHQMHPTVITSV